MTPKNVNTNVCFINLCNLIEGCFEICCTFLVHEPSELNQQEKKLHKLVVMATRKKCKMLTSTTHYVVYLADSKQLAKMTLSTILMAK